MCRFTKFFLKTIASMMLLMLVLIANSEIFLTSKVEAALSSNFNQTMVNDGGGAACIHSYSAATCTKPQTCTKCGATTGSKLGHNYQFTSCVTQDKCTRCGQKTGTPTGHPGYSQPTCTKDSECIRCGEIKTGTKLGHDYKTKTIKAAKCAETGIRADVCTRCQAETNRQPIMATGHSYSAATCTKPQTCTKCGATTGSKLSHVFECRKIDATWHAEYCKNCDYSKTMERHIMQNNICTACNYEFICNHTYVAATCTKPQTCTKCGATTGSKLGHDYKTKTIKAAKCAETGIRADICTRCQAETNRQPIMATGHSYSAATCTKPQTCNVCGATNGDVLPHDYSTRVGKFYNEKQHYEKYKCSCGAITYKNYQNHVLADDGKCKYACGYVKKIDVQECNHTYEWIIVKNATCKENGIKENKCTKCNNVQKTETITALGHDYENATCTEARKCKICGATDGKALGHKFEKSGNKYDEKYHYEVWNCSCGESEKRNQKEHEIVKDKCSCGFEVDHKHEFTKSENKFDEKYHYEVWKCWCGKTEKRNQKEHEIVKNKCSCGFEVEHKHEFIKSENKFDEKYHYEVWKCACGETEERNSKGHTLNNNKCECGYTFVCKHDAKIRKEYIYKNENEHIENEICEKCNVIIKENVKVHDSNLLETNMIDDEKHSRTLQCKLCGKKYFKQEGHEFDRMGLCGCGLIKENEEIKLEKIVFENDQNSSKNTYTLKVGEIINLKNKIKITPVNANVNLKFTMISGENGSIVLETYSGKLEAKKVSSQTIKVKVTDIISGLSDEVIINVKENPELKEETEETKPPKFEDIEEDSWYKDEVEDAVEDGLFNGTSENTFSPNDPITRGMFVTVLARMDKADIENFANVFDDVKEDAYYQESISWAVANGIVKGVGEGKFSPDAQITREAMAVIIYNYIKISHNGLLEEVVRTEKFVDQSEISDWAEEAVMALKSIGLVNGKSEGYYMPKDTVTRAEGAVILQRLSERIKTDEIEKEEERCSDEKVREDHKQNIKTEYEIVTNDTHRIKYNCVECKNNWVDKPVAHNFKDGICACGYECLHDGSKITDERYNNDGQLVKVTICENCKVVTKEEVVEVNTSSYSPSDFSQYKPVIGENTYTDEDWERMEAELKARVEKAGFGTRAGVVEAALYLASLDYAMPYRGTPMDANGDIGFYSKYGLNKTWGRRVALTKTVTTSKATYKKGTKVVNGMDCIRFVTWAFVNGGVINPGDDEIAYKTAKLTQDKGSLSDRMKRELEYTNLRAHPLKNVVDEVEPGDIIYTYGTRNGKRNWTHIGLIVGVDADNIYVAESNTTTYSPDTESHSLTVNKLVVTRIPKTYTKDVLGYVVLCDDTIYKAKNPDGTENKGNMPQVWGN